VGCYEKLIQVSILKKSITAVLAVMLLAMALWPEPKKEGYLSKELPLGENGEAAVQKGKYYWIHVDKSFAGACSFSLLQGKNESKRLYFNEDMPAEKWNGVIQFLGETGPAHLQSIWSVEALQKRVELRELNGQYYLFRDCRFWFLLLSFVFLPVLLISLWGCFLVQRVKSGIRIFSRQTAGMWVALGFGISLWMMLQSVWGHPDFSEKRPYGKNRDWTGEEGFQMTRAVFLADFKEPFLRMTGNSIQKMLGPSQAAREWGAEGLSLQGAVRPQGVWDLYLWWVGRRASSSAGGILEAFEEARMMIPFLQGIIYLLGWKLLERENRGKAVGWWVVLVLICSHHLWGYEAVIWQMATLVIVYGVMGRNRWILGILGIVTASMSSTITAALFLALFGIVLSRYLIQSRVCGKIILESYPWIMSAAFVFGALSMLIGKILATQSFSNNALSEKVGVGIAELHQWFLVPAGGFFLVVLTGLGKRGFLSWFQSWRAMSLLIIPPVEVMGIGMWILGIAIVRSGIFLQEALWFGAMASACWVLGIMRISQRDRGGWLWGESRKILALSLLAMGMISILPGWGGLKGSKPMGTTDSPWVAISKEGHIDYFLAKSPGHFWTYIAMQGYKIAPLVLDLNNGQYLKSNVLKNWGMDPTASFLQQSRKTPNEWLQEAMADPVNLPKGG
jgi:hypothetical protein